MLNQAGLPRAKHLAVGQAGEQAAARHLAAKGYRIVERNHRTRWGEIDLIVRRKDMLVFVEVRTRQGSELSEPEETLTPAKLRRVERNAQAYASRHRWEGACRIDAICIVLEPRTLGLGFRVIRLRHYENITAS